MKKYSQAIVTTLAVSSALLLTSGCTSGPAPGTSPASGSELPQGSEPVKLDPADFTTEIDNTYWPMVSATRWVYRETDADGEVLRVVVTVSSETKEIANGITARVVRDTVSRDGETVEDTFDWYAQDAQGAIWYLGEDTAEFEGGEVASTEGSFEAGVDGALPGVIMPGTPAVGLAYRQEFYAGKAEDNGQVLSVDEMADTAVGHFDDVLLTKDTAAIEPDVLEYKLYAADVGPVLAFGVSGDLDREELVEITHVSPDVAHAAGTAPLGQPYE